MRPPDTLFARLLLFADPAARSRPALVAGSRSWTYAELEHAVLSAAHALRALGVTAGDRVLIVLPNSPEFVVAFLGTTALGAIAVPVDYQAGIERLSYVTTHTSPRLCLRSADRPLPESIALAEHTIKVGEGLAGTRLEPGPPTTGTDEEPALPDVDETAAAVILFSAGSTGRPKGAVLEHRQLLKIARTLVGVVGMDADHRDLILSPMTHSGGWQRVTSTLLAGGTVVISEGPPAVPTLLENVRDHAIRGFFAAPPLLRVLLMTAEKRVREAMQTLRSIESASAPLSPSELERLMRLLPGVDVFFQYGLTECSRALILDARSHPDKLHTVGLPTDGVEVRIAGPDGAELGPGEKGEVLLAAPQRAERYWNSPELNVERFRDQWLLTGDIGSVDAEGFLTYHGRQDDMINHGGLSYFPAEVERELGSVAGVVEYIVAGVPDPAGIFEHVPWAFVVPEDPESWHPRTLIAAARDRLPPHMVPRRVVTLPSMPLIASGKPDRRRVVAEHAPVLGDRQ